MNNNHDQSAELIIVTDKHEQLAILISMMISIDT